MLADFLIVTGQVVTLFLMMGAGYFFAKRGWLSDSAQAQMSHILLYLVAPCVILDSLTKAERTSALLRSFGLCLVLTVAVYLLYILLAQPLFPRIPADTRNPLRFAVVYGNIGFMGLPLIQSVLGAEALLFCTVVLAVFNIITWTHGVLLMGGRDQLSLGKALLNPGVIGCLAGLILFLSGAGLPSPVATAIDYLADLNTPLAMLVLGGQMAGARLTDTFRPGPLYLVSLLRLVVLPALTALLLLPFHQEALVYCTLVILSGCPTAGITGMFAQQFRRDSGAAAQAVTLSTLLSIVTLPILATAARALAGSLLV